MMLDHKESEMRKMYSGAGMNWTWYAEVETHEDGTATIWLHDRLHNERDSHPEAAGTFRMQEDKTRTVEAVWLDGKLYPVRNSQYVFAYPEFK